MSKTKQNQTCLEVKKAFENGCKSSIRSKKINVKTPTWIINTQKLHYVVAITIFCFNKKVFPLMLS